MRVLLAMILLPVSIAWARPMAKAHAKKKAPATKTVVASENLTVRELVITGQRKIEKDAILAKLKTHKGDPYEAANIREDVLALFKLGYFNDVQVDRKVDGSFVDLTYKVLEKPSVTEIIYDGNSELKSEEIGEAAGLKPYEILSMAKVREATEKIQKLYEDKGYFLAKIDPEVTVLKADESVKLTYKIVEGEKVKVKKIVFIGAKKVSEEVLKDHMMTKEEGYFTGLSGSGSYKQEAFERDIQIIRLTYYNQGYIQAKVDRPQISVTPDKKGIYLTIRVEEGEQYYVGEVDFAGDLMFPKAELFDTIKIDKNGVFAYDVLQKDLGELQAKYGDLGYAYANVIPRWEFREAEKKVNLIFEIDKGNKVYFGRIDVTGNGKTRDKVVRRELRIRETELYNETRRRKSLENIQRLGYFDEVNFKTSTPPDQLDVMNVEIVVKERNTGQIQVSAGYGTSTGFTFGGSLQQTNFLGRGQSFGISMQLTSITSVYDLSFTDPYFNDTDWSLGARIFQSSNSGRLDYDERRTGATVTLGHPITDYTRFSLSYGYTAIRLFGVWLTNVNGSGGNFYATDPILFPLNTAEGDASTVSANWSYDTRNDRMRASKGHFLTAGVADTGLVGGNLHYYTVSTNYYYFKNLFWDVVWRNGFSYGYINSTDPSRDPPFNELYLLGGPYSLRGYRFARVGKMRFSNTLYLNEQQPPLNKSSTDALLDANRFYGGHQKVQNLTELQFPLVKEANMFGVVFFDAGEADDELTSVTDDPLHPGRGIYSDWGFGIRWYSPIGVLRFEWGFPFRRDTQYDDASVFEFSIGPSF